MGSILGLLGGNWQYIVIIILGALLFFAKLEIDHLNVDIGQLKNKVEEANNETKKANDTIVTQNENIKKIGKDNQDCFDEKSKVEQTLKDVRNNYEKELVTLRKITSTIESMKNIPVSELQGGVSNEDSKKIIRSYNDIFTDGK